MSKTRHPRKRLVAWVEASQQTQREVAKSLRTSEAHFSRVLSGGRMPGLRLAIRIAELTGIPVEAWLKSGAAA